MTSKAVDLIYEGVKYRLRCCQAGPRLFTVSTPSPDADKGGFGGKSLVEAQCRPLADGGYLLVIAGKSQASIVSPLVCCRFPQCSCDDRHALLLDIQFAVRILLCNTIIQAMVYLVELCTYKCCAASRLQSVLRGKRR